MSGFAGLDPCVHCGFCLQSCPTFVATGDEADGPRGRIVLMQALRHHRLSGTDDALAFHLDRCLGCRACEPACPSGVRYGAALETARHEMARVRSPALVARIVTTVMAEPALRTPLLTAARIVRPLAGRLARPSRLGFGMGMLAATRAEAPSNSQIGSATDARVAIDQGAVTLFRGCVMDGLFSHVHNATARTLAANGLGPIDTPGQVCCGALHAHTGQHGAAVRLARQNVRAFSASPERTIVVNAAGCGAMLKQYGDLLSGDAVDSAAQTVAGRVRDVSEVLASRGPRIGASLDLRVAYDPPCHLLYAQRIDDQPRQILDAVPGIEHIEHTDAEMCCGSAGSYSLTEPELSREVLAPKIRALVQAEPDVVATGNPGCVMQIGAGLRAAGVDVPVVHPVEILDWSYRKAGYYDAA